MARIGLWTVVLLASLAAVLSVRARVADGGTPEWDSASHGVQGVALAQDVARFDLADLAADALGHRYRYPPGHPALLAAAYLAFGPSWWTAVGVSAVLFAALAAVLYATAESKVAGWLAALLALTCPALLALSGQIMLEIPAAILVTLAFRLYARSLEDDGAVRPLGWTLFVFLITAAQYAACAISILLAFELWRARRFVRETLGRFVRSRALYHPMHVLIGLALLLALAIRVSGGWTIPLGSRTLSMTRAGGPLISAALLAGLRVGWLVWTRRAELRGSVPKRYRDMFITGIVPCYLWVFVIYPPRFQQFAEWISRPPEGHARTDPAHWSYYPAYFLEAGQAALAMSVGVAAFVAASFLRRASPERIRFLRWAVLAGAVLVLLHPARQVRFIVPFLPTWWVLASETWTGLFPAVRSRLLAAAAATAAIVLPALGLYGRDLSSIVSPPPINREYARVLRWTVDRIDQAPSVRVIGGIEGLSRHLFEWELRRRSGRPPPNLGFNLDLPADFDRDPEGPRKVFEAWLARDPEHLVAVLEPIDLDTRPPRPVGEIRKSDHDWPEFAMRFLRGEARYEIVEERAFDDARVRIRIYRRSILVDTRR